MRISKITLSALVAGMMLCAAAASVVALSSNATGYMVEVHTCDEDKAGTNSLIWMTLDIRDEDWKFHRLGPWTQDIRCQVKGAEYDDHEQDEWDRYFFPASIEARHIEKLRLYSDGKHGNPGWCWDSLYVTTIKNGRQGWTWAWEGKSPWIDGRIQCRSEDKVKGACPYDFVFTYGATGRQISPALFEDPGRGYACPGGGGVDLPPGEDLCEGPKEQREKECSEKTGYYGVVGFACDPGDGRIIDPGVCPGDVSD